jgi:hypothetical protein
MTNVSVEFRGGLNYYPGGFGDHKLDRKGRPADA